MARFSAIPEPPMTDMTSWQFYMLNALKENVELLTGTRGEEDGASRAVTKSSITVTGVTTQSMQNVTAQGAGVSIEGAVVPTLEDYVEALKNIQMLANDVSVLRTTLNTLIAQLRG